MPEHACEGRGGGPGFDSGGVGGEDGAGVCGRPRTKEMSPPSITAMGLRHCRLAGATMIGGNGPEGVVSWHPPYGSLPSLRKENRRALTIPHESVVAEWWVCTHLPLASMSLGFVDPVLYHCCFVVALN